MSLMTFIQAPQFEIGNKVRDKDSCKEWRRRYKYWTVMAIKWYAGAWFYQCGPGFWVRESGLERYKK
jgi:hypothetical protein